MSFKSILNTGVDTVIEFHTEMMTDCVACERPTLKTRDGRAAICPSCQDSDSFGVFLVSIFTGAGRSQRFSTAVSSFIDRKVSG